MIKEFRGEYRWLSNFELVDIEYQGVTYPSSEHAYMSAKKNSVGWKFKCADRSLTCGDIKSLGSKIELREDWEDIKLQVMEEILTIKFSKEPYRTKLLDTGVQNLQEGNRWNDKFWGVCLKENPNEGENHLGRIIMKIRDKLREENIWV